MKNARVKEFERVHVCGMISHLLCGIVMCCVMAFFFLLHTEPAQLSVGESEKEGKEGRENQPTNQPTVIGLLEEKWTNSFTEGLESHTYHVLEFLE